jgi:hypothetical protein
MNAWEIYDSSASPTLEHHVQGGVDTSGIAYNYVSHILDSS